MNKSRRDFVKIVVAGTVAAGCPIDSSLLIETAGTPALETEDFRICHTLRDGKFFSSPPVEARHDVVIIGGGVSGLTAAYMLRHRDCLVLEKEPHWGGNAYTMEYQGIPYPTGCAFLPNDEDAAYAFVKELGLEPLPINNWDGSIIRGEYIADTWGDGLERLPYARGIREGFRQFKRSMLSVNLRTQASDYLNVPLSKFTDDAPGELRSWWDAYGLSNWGTATEETPAAVAITDLQDFAGDNRRDTRYMWPGGNGELAKRLIEILHPIFGRGMQTGATVVRAVSDKTEVRVTYIQGDELKTVAGTAVVVAAPKLIARQIIEGLPQEQRVAMASIRYIPYVVVNLVFDKPVFDSGFNTWCPGNSFTDFIVADWVLRRHTSYQPKFNILTCYVPMREEDRIYLLSTDGTRKIASNVLRDFQRMLPQLSAQPVEVHIFRRGHPLFKSVVGLHTHVQPLARRSMDRVFIAHSDSEGPVPTIDAAVASGRRCAKEVENRLAGKPASK